MAEVEKDSTQSYILKKILSEPITFDSVPKVLSILLNEVSELKSLIRNHQPAPQQPEVEFITLKQVCQLTGYAAPTLYALISKNEIPYFKIRAKLFFERTAILAWIREGKRKTKADIDASADAHLQKRKAKNLK